MAGLDLLKLGIDGELVFDLCCLVVLGEGIELGGEGVEFRGLRIASVASRSISPAATRLRARSSSRVRTSFSSDQPRASSSRRRAVIMST